MPSKYEQDREWIAEQLRLGASYTEMAKRYDVTRENMRQTVERMGLKHLHQHTHGIRLKRQAIHLTKYHRHYRKCPKCHELKAPDEYSWKDKAHTRRDSHCKRCVADKVNALRNTPEGLKREREWRAANPGRMRDYARKWQQSHKEQTRALHAEWRKRNIEKWREGARRRSSAYYAKHRDAILAKAREVYHQRKAAKQETPDA